MPFLNKSRMINISYNDNRRTIYDETFDYGRGHHTLFAMDNGLGKTVLIQFLLQPFMRTKRELSNRKFDSYFTKGETSYIMHEVLKENNEFLLVGMVIKKEVSEDANDKLRILAFTHAYAKHNDFDIVSIPFVEGKRILKFSEAEEIIKNYAKGKTDFKYFNFNDSQKRSEYFDELHVHNIDFKEWEDVIRKINNDESGLSTLYDKHKDDEALLKGEIFPLIESKLNNQIEEIRENVKHYIKSYQSSKESIKRLEVYQEINEELSPVINMLDEGVKLKQKDLDNKNELRNLALFSIEVNQKLKDEKMQHEEINSGLEGKLKRIEYEKTSYEYYLNEAKLEEINNALVEHEQTKNNITDTIKETTRQKYVLEAAEQYNEINEMTKSLITIQEQRKNIYREDNEIIIMIKNFRFTLSRLYQDQLIKLLHEQELNKDDIQEVNDLINTNTTNSRKIQDLMSTIKGSIANLKYQINEFHQQDTKLRKKYSDFSIDMNPITQEYKTEDLNRILNTIDTYIKKINKDITRLNDEKATNTNKQKETMVLVDKLSQDKAELQANLLMASKDYELFKQETSKIEDILLYKNLDHDVFKSINNLKNRLASDIEASEILISDQTKEMEKIQHEINRYKTGLIEIPQEIKNAFEDKGVEFEYGLKFLQDRSDSEKEKLELIYQNPLFPYSILMTKRDIEVLKNERFDIFTSIPIPIISYDNLKQALSGERHHELVIVNDQHFLIHFNDSLIDEGKRVHLISELEDRIKIKQNELSQTSEKLKKDRQYRHIVDCYPYQGNEGKAYESEILSLNDQIKLLDTDIISNNKTYDTLKTRFAKIGDEILNLNNDLNLMSLKKADVNDVIASHQKYLNNKSLHANENIYLKDTLNKVNELSAESLSLQIKLKGLEFGMNQINRDITETKTKIATFDKYREGVLMEGDIDILESKLRGLENQCNANLSGLYTQEQSWVKQIQKAQEKLDEVIISGGLQEDDYRNLRYNSEDKKAITSSLNKYKSELDKITAAINQLDIKKATHMGVAEGYIRDLNRLGFDGPVSKTDIGGANFDDRMDSIKEEMKANRDRMDLCLQKIRNLEALINMLDQYLTSEQQQYDEGFTFDFSNLDTAISIIKNIKKESEQVEKEIKIIEEKLHKMLNDLYEAYRDKDHAIKEQLKLYLNKESIIDAQNDLPLFRDYVIKTIQRISLAVKYIEEEEGVINNLILRYCSEVQNELETIDKKSSIKINDKSQKLMEIKLPERVEEESVKQYVNSKVEELSGLNDIDNIVKKDISTDELMDKYIGGLSHVKIIIKKIEKNTITPKTWKETLFQNSGGEKFVSMFILLACFLSYMRKNKDISIKPKEERKVVIMDNPFAKTNAEHLLEPMFDIANKYNIQLICFSGIGGSSVYNQFNRIYTAKIINDQFQNKERVEFVSENRMINEDDTLEFSQFRITQEKLF